MNKICKDMVGKRFSKLVVIELSEERDASSVRRWLCRCDCGNTVVRSGKTLRNGTTKSCGCSRERGVTRERTESMSNRNFSEFYIGKTFYRLSVVGLSEEKDKYGRPLLVCSCSCGTRGVLVHGGDLKRGFVKSCGCLKRENTLQKNRNKRLPPGEAARNKILRHYKFAAKNRGYVWELEDEFAFKLFEQECFYCGVPPSGCSKGISYYGDYYYNGIDRVDNTKGYLEGNVVTCCGVCNKIKNALTLEEFILKCHTVAKRHPLE